MALLLSGASKNSSAASGFVTPSQTQAALGPSPTTSTGYTLVTINSLTSYVSTLGKLNFTFTNTATLISSTINDGNIIINPNGTGTTYINGPVVIPDLQAITGFKGTVKAATTASITLVGGSPIVVDGYALTQLDRVLVRSQTNPAENGIYVVSYLGLGSNGTWVRSPDTDTSKKLANSVVAVSYGDHYPGHFFFNTYSSELTLESDPIYWYEIVADTLPQILETKEINNSPIGQLIPAVGHFTNLQASSSTHSVSTNTGALVVKGGVGVGGELNVGGITNILNATTATSTFTAALLVAGGLGVNGSIYARAVYVDGVPLNNPYWNGGQITDPFYVANIEEAYNTMTGALKVLGGVGIGGSVYMGKKLVIESRSVTDTVNFTMRNTATSGWSYTWAVGGNNAAGTGGTSLREGSLTLYSDTDGAYKLAVSKTTGNLLVGVSSDNVTDKLQVAGSIKFNDSQLSTRSTAINNTNTTEIDSFVAADYRTSKALVQISDGIGPSANFHVVEIIILIDNQGNIYKSEYGVITTGGEVGIFDVDYNNAGNGLVRLFFKANSSSAKVVKVVRQCVAR